MFSKSAVRIVVELTFFQEENKIQNMALFLSLTVFVLQVALMIELQTYLDITSAVTFDFSDQYQYLGNCPPTLP